MLAADIDDRNGGIRQILRRRFAAYDVNRINRYQQTAGKELIFVRASGVGEDEGKRHAVGKVTDFATFLLECKELISCEMNPHK
jgi:hypothetical protein